MNEADILAAFHTRREHYDTWLQANDVQVCTCTGCGFPTLEDICIICNWENNGIGRLFEELQMSGIDIPGPTLTENRINIGRMLESYIELIGGEVDFDTARVLRTIDFYRQRRDEINGRMTGEELPQDHIWMEWKEVGRDLLMALVVPKL